MTLSDQSVAVTARQRGEIVRIEARYGRVRLHEGFGGCVEVELLEHASSTVVTVPRGMGSTHLRVPTPPPRLRLDEAGRIVAGRLEHPFDFGASARGRQAIMEQTA